MHNIHMIGIGGIGMSAIAQLLLGRGDKVSGCDEKENPITAKLKRLGVDVLIGHNPKHIDKSLSLVTHTSAVKSDHPELLEAGRQSIPIFRRAQLLADIVKGKKVAAVTGTHGKTTTSFMTAYIMNYAGLRPGFAIGGEVDELGGNARWSNEKYFVFEADESDGTQTYIDPYIAVVTNIDCDHMEYYSDIFHIARIMQDFIDKVPEDGLVIGCGEDVEVRKILSKTDRQRLTYGFNSENDIYVTDVVFEPKRSIFNVWYKGSQLGKVNLNIPGRHNILNAMAAIGACLKLEIPFNKISNALSIYPGVRRRLDVVFQNAEFTVTDDYAHHPREIKAVIDTVCSGKKGRNIGIFQPHRYTRTKLLASDFGSCFEGLDKLILTDIYSAGEAQIKGVDGRLIYNEVIRHGKPETVYIESKKNILDYLMPQVLPGDNLIFMGAGDITELAHNIRSYMVDLHKATVMR